uniref:Poly(ADP-ribose) glycohydrolase n=1 Tax=Caenorhabditis tropicalis TaxID=1561998 RepID=A0A1I7U650_9PELO
MIVSMLISDRMEPDEAISIVGAQVYSSYTGYSGKLKYSNLRPEHSIQNLHRDEYGRIKTEAIAINAIKFFGRQSKNLGEQLEERNLKKELMKSGVGFCAQGAEFEGIPIVSGWWGCGAYNGNKPLKFLIQLIAASIAKRPLYFCTFGEKEIGKKCQEMKKKLDSQKITIGELYDILLKIPRMEVYDEMHVFDSIDQILSNIK